MDYCAVPEPPQPRQHAQSYIVVGFTREDRSKPYEVVGATEYTDGRCHVASN
jgi:hypothetical protein